MAKKKLTYETALAELEEIINTMEDSNMPLKDLVKDYGRGMELLAFCHEELTGAQEEVRKVIRLKGKDIVEDNLNIEGE